MVNFTTTSRVGLTKAQQQGIDYGNSLGFVWSPVTKEFFEFPYNINGKGHNSFIEAHAEELGASEEELQVERTNILKGIDSGALEPEDFVTVAGRAISSDEYMRMRYHLVSGIINSTLNTLQLIVWTSGDAKAFALFRLGKLPNHLWPDTILVDTYKLRGRYSPTSLHISGEQDIERFINPQAKLDPRWIAGPMAESVKRVDYRLLTQRILDY